MISGDAITLAFHKCSYTGSSDERGCSEEPGCGGKSDCGVKPGCNEEWDCKESGSARTAELDLVTIGNTGLRLASKRVSAVSQNMCQRTGYHNLTKESRVLGKTIQLGKRRRIREAKVIQRAGPGVVLSTWKSLPILMIKRTLSVASRIIAMKVNDAAKSETQDAKSTWVESEKRNAMSVTTAAMG